MAKVVLRKFLVEPFPVVPISVLGVGRRVFDRLAFVFVVSQDRPGSGDVLRFLGDDVGFGFLYSAAVTLRSQRSHASEDRLETKGLFSRLAV